MRKVEAAPENDYEAVEEVESVAYVAERAVGDDLEQHLDGEQHSEEQVAVLEHLRQYGRLKRPPATAHHSH